VHDRQATHRDPIGNQGRIFERSNFRSKHRSLTLSARKDALLSRDREGVGAFLVPAMPGEGVSMGQLAPPKVMKTPRGADSQSAAPRLVSASGRLQRCRFLTRTVSRRLQSIVILTNAWYPDS
jgi:hypothetical protein